MIAAVVVAAACGRAPDPLAESIRRELTSTLGQPIRSVRCQPGACVATTATGLAIPITVTGTAPATWTTAQLIDPAPIAAEVHAALTSIGADQGVDCGALRLADDAGPRVECGLAGGVVRRRQSSSSPPRGALAAAPPAPAPPAAGVA